jgi:hypothetical protein
MHGETIKFILILKQAVNMWLIPTCLKGVGVVRNFWVLIILWSFVCGLEKFWGLNDSAIYNECGVHVETKHSLQTVETVGVFHSDWIRAPCGAWWLLFIRIRYGTKWSVRTPRCGVVSYIQAPWNSLWTVKIEVAMQDMNAPCRRLAYKAQISHLIN